MFGFNKLKMKKEELENENGRLREELNRANEENKRLTEISSIRNLELNNLRLNISELKRLNTFLEAKLKMNRFSDDEKIY